jgi:hypothetical protein
MVNGDAAFGQDLLKVAVRERTAKIPAESKNDDVIGEMGPLEQRRRRSVSTRMRPAAKKFKEYFPCWKLEE